MNVKPVVTEYLKAPLSLARDVLLEIASKHRIQGSTGLVEAIEYIGEILKGLGYRTRFIEVPSGSSRGLVDSPLSWDVVEGELEIKIGDRILESLRLADHPTLVSAHSPPSEGCGRISVCSTLDCRGGEVVLTNLPAYIAYKAIDARLILVYDSNRYPKAVPYTGLFLGPGEVVEKSVMSIPYEAALRIMSLLLQNPAADIMACWRVKSRFSTEPLKVLVACNSEDPKALFLSHICHPKPGAHDNASGSVANLLAAFNASQSAYKVETCHAWVPEYTGTVYISDYVPAPDITVNLDMVGSKQHETDSTLNIVMAPSFMKHVADALAYLSAKIVLDTSASFGGFTLPGSRYGLSPYTAGSDHDVTISWGWSSVMFNEWPSKYYHTDMDEIHTISLKNLVKIASAATLTTYIYEKTGDVSRLEEIFSSHVKTWYQIEAAKTGHGSGELEIVSRYWSMLRDPRGIPSIVPSRVLMKKVGYDKYLKMRNIRGGTTYLMTYLPLAVFNNISARDAQSLFQAENLLKWSKTEEDLINEATQVVLELLGM